MKLKKDIEKYIPYNEQEENDKKVMLESIEKMRDILYRDNKVCHMTASSWIVNKEKTKVLMIYHNIYNSWAWTGGHSDGEQDLEYVAIKESKEETGIDNIKVISDGIFSLEIGTVESHVKRGKYVPCHLHFNVTYLLEADENDLIKIKEDENSNVAWFELEEVVNKSTEEDMKKIYRKLNEKLIKMKN